MFKFSENEALDLYAKIKIIGIGDFGAKMVNYSIEKVLLNVNFSVVATKNETLLKSSAPQRVKVEDNISEKSKRIFSELMADVDLLCIFTDLTDENISTLIAELSKSYLTVAIVPESAPNKEKFQNLVDTLISVEDENNFLMYSVVHCITSLVGEPGLVGLDFADVRSVLGNSGRSYVAYGKATGKTPAIDAMKNAMNPLKDILGDSKHLLIGIFGSVEEFSMMEVNEATTILQEAVHPEAEIIWGVTPDVTNADFIEVIIIASGLEK